MASLVSLSTYKLAIGETDASRDTYHQLALDHASAAILNESDRDFGAATVTENRTYWYDGKGILNIDECSVVNSVTFQGASALPVTAYRARKEGPASVTVFSFLELARMDRRNLTSMGVMGFTANLDRYLTGGFEDIQTTVNATWGWPSVPEDVQRATIWTAYDYEQTSGSATSDLAAKSVADVAESYFSTQVGGENQPVEPLPARARAIIDNYQRIRV